VASNLLHLDYGLSSPGLSPSSGHCVVFLGETLLSQCVHSTNVYRWVPANLMGCNTVLPSNPIQGGVETPV